MDIARKKRWILTIACLVFIIEMIFLGLHWSQLTDIIIHYGWVTPLLFFKSLVKKFLLLNVFGLLKVLSGLLWHAVKLLLVKLLKTVGIRYGAYFSTQKWRKASQRLRILGKRLTRLKRSAQQVMMTFSKREYALIIIAFFPLLLLLFLFGVAFKMTREAMVKKGGEIGVAKVAFGTAQKNRGLIARLRQLDDWILRRIERLTQPKN